MDTDLELVLAQRAVLDFDTYYDEAQSFEWDLHILIIGTMKAGEEQLSKETDKALADLDKYAEHPKANHERLSDERVDALWMYSDQTRFLRNSALVSLTSRLYQALRRMANTAERFSPRTQPRYSDGRFGGKNEFKRLWNEIEARFGLDMQANQARINFVEPMVLARNKIVHEGSEISQLKDDFTPDLSFANDCPEYVSDRGIYAEIDAKEEVLEGNFKASNELVKWLAVELRKREVAHFATPPSPAT